MNALQCAASIGALRYGRSAIEIACSDVVIPAQGTRILGTAGRSRCDPCATRRAAQSPRLITASTPLLLLRSSERRGGPGEADRLGRDAGALHGSPYWTRCIGAALARG